MHLGIGEVVVQGELQLPQILLFLLLPCTFWFISLFLHGRWEHTLVGWEEGQTEQPLYYSDIIKFGCGNPTIMFFTMNTFLQPLESFRIQKPFKYILLIYYKDTYIFLYKKKLITFMTKLF